MKKWFEREIFWPKKYFVKSSKNVAFTKYVCQKRDSCVWSLRNFCITWEPFREINFTVKLFSQKFFEKPWYKNFVNSTAQCERVTENIQSVIYTTQIHSHTFLAKMWKHWSREITRVDLTKYFFTFQWGKFFNFPHHSLLCTRTVW